MRRRAFIAGLGSAAAWPVVARAQQPAIPIVGCLMNLSQGEADYILVPFREGLADTGYVEGRNVSIEYRWGEGRNERTRFTSCPIHSPSRISRLSTRSPLDRNW
jgi:putative ABC transport system substrate-binding protein